jgi:hypothetical protein
MMGGVLPQQREIVAKVLEGRAAVPARVAS